LTFAAGPRLIDTEHAPDPLDDKEELEDEDEGQDTEAGGCTDANAELSPTDQTHLLSPRLRRASVVSVSFFPSRPRESSTTAIIYDRRPLGVSKRQWLELGDRTRWWLLFLYDFLNAPLIGAVLGAIIGLVPALHRSFFSDTADGGFFTAWLTASLKNVGSVFVPLPVVVAGVSLYTSMQKVKSEENAYTSGGTPWLTTVFILATRFVVWPVLSISVIYFLAKETNVLGVDPMLWFTMMLMPTGPPAMKLITMVEVSDADEEDEHKIAKLLTVSCCTSHL
jgi:predicted permease